MQFIFRRQLQHIGDKHFHADRNITHADKALKVGVAIHRLGNHPRRVGKVDDPGIRADLLYILHDIKNHRNGTQTFKQTAGAVSLLTEIAVTERNTFIFFTRLQLANPQLRGDEMSPFQRGAAIQRFVDFHRHARFFHHTLAQRMDNIEFLLPFFYINQPQFCYRQFVITFDKPLQ